MELSLESVSSHCQVVPVCIPLPVRVSTPEKYILDVDHLRALFSPQFQVVMAFYSFIDFVQIIVQFRFRFIATARLLQVCSVEYHKLSASGGI